VQPDNSSLLPGWAQRLDALHVVARRSPALHRLAIISRILLALAFLPTGLVKLMGRRFTVLDADATSVGAFFEAMYQTGFYWNFLGLGQVVAAVLLLIPATRTLGAVLFLPIMANVTVVTWSIDFAGTRLITLLMMLASVFLVCWDWHRVRSILVPPGATRLSSVPSLPRVERVGYVLGTASGLAFLMAARDFESLGVPAAVVGAGGSAAAVVLVLAGWVTAWRTEFGRRREARRRPTGDGV